MLFRSSLEQRRQPSPVHSRPASPSGSVPGTAPALASVPALGPVPMPGLGRSTSAQVLPTVQRPLEDARSGRSQSFTAFGASSARVGNGFDASGEGSRGRTGQLPAVAENSPNPSNSSASPRPSPQPGSTPPAPSPPLRAGQFIDDELLRGVSKYQFAQDGLYVSPTVTQASGLVHQS